MPTRQAAKDLRNKLKLEAGLRADLERYNRTVVREFRMMYGLSGNALNMNSFNDELVEILNGHWFKTGILFSEQIGPTLPRDVAETEGERTLIREALSLWYIGRITDHAQEINVTTQKNMVEAIELAEEDPEVRAFTGREAQLTAAAIAAGTLSRKLKGRVSTIVMTETQIPAETAKATEAEVLSGIPPSISGSSPRTVELTKQWFSIGDSLVRPAHLDADGQIRPVNEPFLVGGELLRWPGDTSLGASIENIAGCRCSAVFDKQEIINHRRQ